mgnify:CR=1 FL=1
MDSWSLSSVGGLTLPLVVHGAMLVARAFGDPKSFATIVQPAILKLTQPG